MVFEYMRNKKISGRLFSNRNYIYFGHHLKKFLQKHNLPLVTPHGFRRTHATLLSEANVPVKAIQAQLGHANITTTLDIYTQVTEKQKNNTIISFKKHIS